MVKPHLYYGFGAFCALLSAAIMWAAIPPDPTPTRYVETAPECDKSIQMVCFDADHRVNWVTPEITKQALAQLFLDALAVERSSRVACEKKLRNSAAF